MSIRDVTFEELLAILRSPHELARKRPLKIPIVMTMTAPIFGSLVVLRHPATKRASSAFLSNLKLNIAGVAR